MKIGILKEPAHENRVIMLPEMVAALVQKKVKVVVESGAGERASYSDDEYTRAGAITSGRSSIIEGSDLILAIHPQDDILSGLKKSQVLVAVLNPLSTPRVVQSLITAGVTSFSLDSIPRTTRAQSMDILSSQATVAGYKAVLDAAMHLPRFFPMFMTAAGTIKPAKVLVLGAGVAGLQAISTARRLGAVVEAFDVRSAVRDEVKSLGAKFVEVEGARDDASAGGYAVEQSAEFIEKQRQLVHDHASRADVVITTAQVPGKKAPVLLTRETVETMRPGSVVVDLAASTGGNCELTRDGEVFQHQGVTIIGHSAYPASMPEDASRMLGKNTLNFISLLINENGELALDFDDDIVRGTCITREGSIINERVKAITNA